MAPTVLRLPHQVSLPQLAEWNRQLWKPANEPEIHIDLSETAFFTPFAMMFIIRQLEYYKTRFSGASISITGCDHLEWASSMGFFSTLSQFSRVSEKVLAERKVKPSTAAYLPITTLDTHEFMRANGRGHAEVNEAVDSEAARLARTLTQLGSGYSFDTVQYSLREVMRNVFEHSGSPTLRYCAQYWPATRRVELIISDAGMGIYNSLIGNPNFKNIGERDALHFACLPGVSGNAAAMKDRASGNPWQNSGYGLYMASRLCRNDGDFLIISSDHVLSLRSGEKSDFSLRNIKGTLIRLHLTLNSTRSLRENLGRYTEEGKVIAEGIRGAKVLEASVASQMLRRDFDQHKRLLD